MRFSKQREAVFQVLCATDSHPDVNYIFGEVRKVMPNIGLGTVYRNLEELRSVGRIKKLGVEGSVERFDARTDPHTHFVCTRCGAVMDADCPQCCNVQNCGCGEVLRCEVMLYGICRKCKDGEQK